MFPGETFGILMEIFYEDEDDNYEQEKASRKKINEALLRLF